MRRLSTIAVVLTLVAAPAWAQRGGGDHGGGFSGHAAVSRGGFSGGGHFQGGYRPAVRGFAPGSGAAARFAAPGVSQGHPAFYGRRGRGRWGYGYVGGAPYLYPGVYSGWDGYELGYLDDDGNYDNDAANDAEEPAYGYGPGDEYGPEDGPVEGYPEGPPPGYGEQPPAQAQQTPEEAAQESAAALAQNTSPSLYDADAVTLVFKDGRPPEKIQNYALTRTTVYVTGEHHREIPVASLDLAATEKANRDAGVEFQLPQGQ